MERRTILTSSRLWKEIDIPVIQMEWEWFQTVMEDTPQENRKTEELIRYLGGLGYKPRGRDTRTLENTHWKNWTNEIYWMKDSFSIV